jgi:hypothetical protein
VTDKIRTDASSLPPSPAPNTTGDVGRSGEELGEPLSVEPSAGPALERSQLSPLSITDAAATAAARRGNLHRYAAARSHCHTLSLPHALIATRSHCHTLSLPHALIATRSHCHTLSLPHAHFEMSMLTRSMENL